jgi:cytochrome c-type biogenesis protein CcmH
MSAPSWIARSLAGAASAIVLLASSAAAATPQTTLPDIEDEVMCTICGTLLELSDAPQADRERALIRRLIEQGKTKDQIKDALVAEYGSEVVATPGGEGFDLTAWLIPGLGIALALGGLLLAGTRLRRRSGGDHPEEPPLDPGDAARLDRDLSSYDR